MRDLTFAIPNKRGWMFDQNVPFDANFLVRHYLNNPSHLYNIFASHSQWNSEQVRKLVGIDAKFITILRDPIDVFESGFDYFGFGGQLEMDINEYVARVFHFGRSQRAIFGKNQLLYNVGMKSADMDSPKKVDEMIEMTDYEFDLVLIAEKMEESLILMKNLFCWTMNDIRYFKLNEREEKSKSNMSENTRKKLKKWLWADYLLYNYFVQKMDDSIKQFGIESMKSEVSALKLANLKLKTDCHQTYTNNTDLQGTVLYMASDAVKGLSLDPDCILYAISEPYFFKLIRAKQRFLLS